jgi:hypothetical protein
MDIKHLVSFDSSLFIESPNSHRPFIHTHIVAQPFQTYSSCKYLYPKALYFLQTKYQPLAPHNDPLSSMQTYLPNLIPL